MSDKVEGEIQKHVKKTGTLTLGLICKEGIVLAADRRVSYGSSDGRGVSYIASKVEKIQKVNDRILATTAGTASDNRRTLKIISAELRLKELKTREPVSMKEAASLIANTLFQNIRTPSMIPNISHFLLAGYDDLGEELYDLSPDGYLQKIDTYQATGAPFQAHAILDSDFKKGLTIEEGIKLAKKAFNATRGREPGVGDGFDIYTIKKGEIKKVSAQEIVSELKDEK